MEEEDYRRRRDDHLVEPLFGGLGVEHDPGEPQPLPARAGPLARLWAWLVALVPARWRPRR